MFASPLCSSPIFNFGAGSAVIAFPTDIFDASFDDTFGIDLAPFPVASGDRSSPVFNVSGPARAGSIFDLIGDGRISLPIPMTLASRSEPIFELGGANRLSPVVKF